MKKLLAFLRDILNDAAFLGGAALMSWGAAQLCPPAGYIVAGAALIAYGILIT